MDSCIIPAYRTTFRNFCVSESNLPDGETEQVILDPCESSVPGRPTKHVSKLGMFIGIVTKSSNTRKANHEEAALGIERNPASSPENGKVSL